MGRGQASSRPLSEDGDCAPRLSGPCAEAPAYILESRVLSSFVVLNTTRKGGPNQRKLGAFKYQVYRLWLRTLCKFVTCTRTPNSEALTE